MRLEKEEQESKGKPILSYKEKVNLLRKKYSLQYNLNLLSEECGELIQAIAKYNRTHGEENDKSCVVSSIQAEDNLIEEIADVVVMIERVLPYFCSEQSLKNIMGYKVQRALDRELENCQKKEQSKTE